MTQQEFEAHKASQIAALIAWEEKRKAEANGR
jgi:hypothetical protein